MFIQTEPTPNPATLKFLPGRAVMEEGTFEARDLDAAERSPLARALMQLPGVGGVFFASDFISVTKTEGEWQHLKPAVLGVVTEYYLSGAPLIVPRVLLLNEPPRSSVPPSCALIVPALDQVPAVWSVAALSTCSVP